MIVGWGSAAGIARVGGDSCDKVIVAGVCGDYVDRAGVKVKAPVVYVAVGRGGGVCGDKNLEESVSYG